MDLGLGLQKNIFEARSRQKFVTRLSSGLKDSIYTIHARKKENHPLTNIMLISRLFLSARQAARSIAITATPTTTPTPTAMALSTISECRRVRRVRVLPTSQVNTKKIMNGLIGNRNRRRKSRHNQWNHQPNETYLRPSSTRDAS